MCMRVLSNYRFIHNSIIHKQINNKLGRYYVFGNLYTFHYSQQPYRVSGRARQHDIISYNIILFMRIDVIRFFDSKIFIIKIDVTDIIHNGKIVVGQLAYIYIIYRYENHTICYWLFILIKGAFFEKKSLTYWQVK